MLCSIASYAIDYSLSFKVLFKSVASFQPVSFVFTSKKNAFTHLIDSPSPHLIIARVILLVL